MYYQKTKSDIGEMLGAKPHNLIKEMHITDPNGCCNPNGCTKPLSIRIQNLS